MFGFNKSKLEKIISFIRNLSIELEESDKEKLIKMIRPTFGIKTKSIEDYQIKLGKSKIGGQPDLPFEFEWPSVSRNRIF